MLAGHKACTPRRLLTKKIKSSVPDLLRTVAVNNAKLSLEHHVGKHVSKLDGRRFKRGGGVLL